MKLNKCPKELLDKLDKGGNSHRISKYQKKMSDEENL